MIGETIGNQELQFGRVRGGRAAVAAALALALALAVAASGSLAALTPEPALAQALSAGASASVTGSGASRTVMSVASKKKTDVGKVNWTWNPGKHVYTGEAVRPSWRFTIAGNVIKQGKDYKLSYADNVKAGAATVTLIGIGGYTGRKTFPFKISPASLGSAACASVPRQYYTGKAVTPSLALTFNKKALKKGSDFTLSYENNVAAGTARVTARGKGNFTGKKTVTFSIVKRSPGLGWIQGVAELYKGNSATLRAASSLKSTGAITYASSNASVARVNSKTGALRAVGVGSVTVTATIAASGVYSSQAVSRTIRVRSDSSGFGFYIYGKKQGDNYVWDDLRVGSAVISGDLREYVRTDSAAVITYFSSTPDVFEVDSLGRYRAKRPGYARVCIAQRSNEYYPAAHVFINVAVRSPEGRDVTNLEWQACDALSAAAWNTVAAGVALGQGSLPFDTVVNAVLGADAGNALYGLPQFNSVITDMASTHAMRSLGTGDTTKALARIASKYGLKTGAIGVCAVGTIVYAYHLSENTSHSWRFEHDAAYRESAEGLMREESWQSENGWLEVYRVGQLEGWLQSMSLQRGEID